MGGIETVNARRSSKSRQSLPLRRVLEAVYWLRSVCFLLEIHDHDTHTHTHTVFTFVSMEFQLVALYFIDGLQTQYLHELRR